MTSAKAITSTQGHILVVDDHRTNRRKLSLGLKKQGHTVDEAENGVQALNKLRADAFDLVLLDIIMPEMDGYQVLEQMKGDERLRDLPVIVVSAQDDMASVVKGIEMGADDYLPKTFDPVLLRARIGACLEKKRLRDQERKLQKQLRDANHRMGRELALARDVQASFLPRDLPAISGWQFAVTLKPARETSGDFYDINPLPNGRLGILVADVVDKGAGAALFMALSWTLIRTYAAQYPAQPELVLAAANQRIQKDTNANQFATALYCILDPATGILLYCNAGHCPGYLVRAPNGQDVVKLGSTGVPLGLFKHGIWEQSAIQLEQGDALVLYTDGITEARNEDAGFFDEVGLLDAVKVHMAPTKSRGRLAQGIQGAVIDAVGRFSGNVPQSDDMALVVVVRDGVVDTGF